MAKLGEGDDRWIVKDRQDGANCNNWHWTTKNITSHVTSTLSAAMKGQIFPADGMLAECRIKSAEASGEASVNNRKGRTFLIYQLEMKLKWEGELHGVDGVLLEKCKGSIKLVDVSAESLDDLEFEFETSARGSSLSEAMRKQGMACVKAAVQATIKELQAEVTANAAAEKPQPASLPASAMPQRPIPQPIKVGAAAPPAATAAAASAPRPAPAAGPSKKVVDVSDAKAGSDDEDDEEKPPPPMAEALKKLRDDYEHTPKLRLSNLQIHDVHLKALVKALQHSQCHVEEIDLSFNRLTDAGVHVLLKHFATGLALELTTLYLGGNKVSTAGMAMSQGLKQSRPDLMVIWKLQVSQTARIHTQTTQHSPRPACPSFLTPSSLSPSPPPHHRPFWQLPNGKSMCTVGTVYPQSPAAVAGLRTGDSVIAFGQVQGDEYKGVSESIVPVVKKNVGKPIDVVVVRMSSDSAEVAQISLTLTPQKWSGAGLLGCILK
jgi:hypothetical protein